LDNTSLFTSFGNVVEVSSAFRLRGILKEDLKTAPVGNLTSILLEVVLVLALELVLGNPFEELASGSSANLTFLFESRFVLKSMEENLKIVNGQKCVAYIQMDSVH
jgi:hypothetical protein